MIINEYSKGTGQGWLCVASETLIRHGLRESQFDCRPALTREVIYIRATELAKILIRDSYSHRPIFAELGAAELSFRKIVNQSWIAAMDD